MSIRPQPYTEPWYPFSQAIPEHFSRARYRLTCNECGFEMVFNGSEHAATFARAAGWKEQASAHTCNVCLDRALLRNLSAAGERPKPPSSPRSA